MQPEKLKSFLIDLGFVTENRFKEVERKAIEDDLRIEELLISEKIINREDFARVKAYISGVPFINIKKVDPDVLRIIPERIARANNIIAFRKKGNNLEVGMADPEDLRAIEIVKKATNLNILPRLADPEKIKNALGQYQESLATEFGEIIKKDKDEIKLIKESKTIKIDDDLEKAAEEMPVIKIVDILIKHAVLQRASDIHIEPQEKEIIVRYRIDGVLKDAMTLPVSIALGVVARIKILANLKLDEHRLPQDGRFKIETNDYRYSLRVSILPVSFGEKIVMRLLSENSKVLSLEEIGLRGEALSKVKEFLKKTSGMILVTGPTGSGKTTTLYSILDILNTPKINISTIEDPIEYQIQRINQTQANPKIGLTFASGLKSLVRQDPDVIMVGEIRDNETAQLSINASLTGHLVLSTLHTTNSSGAASRLIDMGIEPFLISSTLNIIIAQRLIRRLHNQKEEYFLNDSDIKNLQKYCDIKIITDLLINNKIIKPGQTLKDVKFYRPQKTKEAPDGYKGRVGIYEVLAVTEPIRDLISKKTSTSKIEKEAKKEGMITMFEDGFIKAASGITSIEEVLRVLIE